MTERSGGRRGRPEAVIFNFECWILDYESKRGSGRRREGLHAEVAERKAGHRLKKMEEDVFAVT